MSYPRIKRPLFWKLLAGSWLTLILVAIGNALVFRSALYSAVPWAMEAMQRFERIQLAVAAKMLEQQGPQSLETFASYLPLGERLEWTTGPVSNKSTTASDMSSVSLSQEVRTAAGVYRLTYYSSARGIFPSIPASLERVPLQLLLVDFVGVTIFAFVIARYLARPVQVLRGGLERVATGDLSVRVGSILADRRDEMADLAQHFDRMAERLQQLLQARERLLHDVSHELRSPLTRLQLAVDLARQRTERSAGSLDRIEREAQRLSDLVEELLSLSRAEFNAANSDAYFAVVELVTAVVADAKFEAQAKGVEVLFEISQTLDTTAGPVMNGSPELLRKGIDNVVRNALKFSDAGQHVTVQLETLGSPVNRLRIVVSDHGPGVPDQDVQRIFEPFVRLDHPARGAGLGLGLAIARSAAVAHGGSVDAVNRPGGGLTVAFELPIHPPIEAKQTA